MLVWHKIAELIEKLLLQPRLGCRRCEKLRVGERITQLRMRDMRRKMGCPLTKAW